MRVLFLSPTLPWPLDSGGAIRTWQLLRALHEREEVHLWAVRQPGITAESIERVEEVCSGLRLFERSSLPWLRRLVAPGPERWFHSSTLISALSELSAHALDVIHIDELCLARGMPELDDVPCFVHHHKLDLELSRALLLADRGSSLEVERWRALETEVAGRFDRHIFCCAEDAERFAARHPSISTAVIESGVDLDAFSPSTEQRDPRHLLFLGSLDYAPNVDGLAWFLSEGWPVLRRTFPDLRFSLVGRSPAEELLEELPEGVTLVGPVPDVRPWLRRATALVVPLRIGGGTRLKICEALATECPVVTTAVGVEGLALEDGRHVFQPRGEETLAGAVTELLSSPEEAARRARAGRERVAERYGWVKLARRLTAEWARG
jgi:polysaccharide biosynthesis protein PslH